MKWQPSFAAALLLLSGLTFPMASQRIQPGEQVKTFAPHVSMARSDTGKSTIRKWLPLIPAIPRNGYPYNIGFL
jgi:hypothetical protein